MRWKHLPAIPMDFDVLNQLRRLSFKTLPGTLGDLWLIGEVCFLVPH